jgi:hypothetical protein
MVAADCGGALGGRNQARKEAHGGSLARAVWPKQAKYLAFLYFKVEVFYRPPVPKLPSEAISSYRVQKTSLVAKALVSKRSALGSA